MPRPRPGAGPGPGSTVSIPSLQDWKQSVRAATTANITLSGLQTVDGVSLAESNRVLVKDQTAGEENGLYNATSGAWVRTFDANRNDEVTPGMRVPVEEGTAAAGEDFRLTTTGAIVLGTTPLAFAQSGSVVGPASSTNNAVARFDGTTGKLLKDSANGPTVTDAGNLGIGTTNPTANIVPTSTRILDISGTGLPSVVLHDTDTTQESSLATSGTGLFVDVAGAAAAANNFVQFRTGVDDSDFAVVNRLKIANDRVLLNTNLDLDGHILLVDEDGDTRIDAQADDVMAFTAGGGLKARITSVGLLLDSSLVVARTPTAASVGSSAESIIGVTDTGAPRTVTLASAETDSGKIIIVKDESGGAGTNNITVATEGAETIDGAATAVISTNFGVLRIYSDGTDWFTF